MLLRNRSRAVTKTGLMADHSSQPSPKQNYARAIPSLFGSPKFITELTGKCVSGTEALRSPTSILDTRALTPFGYEAISTPKKSSSPNDKMDSKGIGLALLDATENGHTDQNSAKGNVVHGKQLRVKIPPTPPIPSSCVYENSGIHTGVMCLSEMELCEEYTCVKSHGPNPRTTHIFEDYIVDTSSVSSPPRDSHSASGTNFLSLCYSCKMRLDHTKDIFIYRGEKAFCSRECRYKEMVLDGAEISEFDSNW
ncbi:protein MARD1-like [Neltuma alba]|uniref:protein MARD1-like n=1 Tax=Neltuma alba TaxID=207710 RepID=UPI0010A3BB1E|nr:protein MARD1-like [Prosopis alba]